MQVEDRPVHRLNVGRKSLDYGLQLGLGHLSRTVPRGRVGVADRQHRIPIAEVDDAAVAVLHPALFRERTVNRPGIVVAGHHPARHSGNLELGLADVEPAPKRLLHQVVEQLLLIGSGHQALELLAIASVRIHPVEGDPRLELGELRLGRHLIRSTLELGRPCPGNRIVHHRHDALAGDVASHDDHVGLVERPGIQELPPTRLRSMNVGCVEQFHSAAWRAAASSSSARIPVASNRLKSRVTLPSTTEKWAAVMTRKAPPLG